MELQPAQAEGEPCDASVTVHMVEKEECKDTDPNTENLPSDLTDTGKHFKVLLLNESRTSSSIARLELAYLFEQIHFNFERAFCLLPLQLFGVERECTLADSYFRIAHFSFE